MTHGKPLSAHATSYQPTDNCTQEPRRRELTTALLISTHPLLYTQEGSRPMSHIADVYIRDRHSYISTNQYLQYLIQKRYTVF